MAETDIDWQDFGGTPVPVIAPARWQDVTVVPGYSVSFKLLSTCIVLTTPAGIATAAAIEGVWRLRNKFLTELLGQVQRFVEVKDFSMVPCLPSVSSRRKQVEMFLRDSRRCKGFVSCGMSMVMRT